MTASAIRHLAAARMAPRVAEGLFKHTIQLWDLHTADRLSQFNTVLDYGGRRVVLNPTGELCVAATWTKGRHGGVACYDALTGSLLWHRTDIRHTQRVRFSCAGESIWCGVQGGRLQHLNAGTGATLDALAGLEDVLDSPHSKQLLLETRTRGFLIKGPNDFRVPRLTLGLLDAVFSPGALCLSEAAGPVRCLDCHTAEERWRYEPPKGTHVLRLTYRPTDRYFYGVEREYERGSSRRLLRFAADSGECEQICQLSSWEEEFCLGSDAIVTSNGEVICVAEGNIINRLAFPQTEYPRPQ
jgi:hypothetical protein